MMSVACLREFFSVFVFQYTVQPAYMERFGGAKTVLYIQKKPYKRGSPIYIHSRKYCTRNKKTSLRDTFRGGFYY